MGLSWASQGFWSTWPSHSWWVRFNTYTPSLASFLFPSFANYVPIVVSLLLNLVNSSNICNLLLLRLFGEDISFPVFPPVPPSSASQFLISFLSSRLMAFVSILKSLLSLSYFVCKTPKAQCLHYVDDITLLPVSQEAYCEPSQLLLYGYNVISPVTFPGKGF